MVQILCLNCGKRYSLQLRCGKICGGDALERHLQCDRHTVSYNCNMGTINILTLAVCGRWATAKTDCRGCALQRLYSLPGKLKQRYRYQHDSEMTFRIADSRWVDADREDDGKWAARPIELRPGHSKLTQNMYYSTPASDKDQWYETAPFVSLFTSATMGRTSVREWHTIACLAALAVSFFSSFFGRFVRSNITSSTDCKVTPLLPAVAARPNLGHAFLSAVIWTLNSGQALQVT